MQNIVPTKVAKMHGPNVCAQTTSWLFYTQIADFDALKELLDQGPFASGSLTRSIRFLQASCDEIPVMDINTKTVQLQYVLLSTSWFLSMYIVTARFKQEIVQVEPEECALQHNDC